MIQILDAHFSGWFWSIYVIHNKKESLKIWFLFLKMRVWRGNAEPLRWLFQESSAPSQKSPLMQSLIIQRRICFSCITIVLGTMVMWPAYAGRLHETLLAPLLPPNLILKKPITFYETWNQDYIHQKNTSFMEQLRLKIKCILSQSYFRKFET